MGSRRVMSRFMGGALALCAMAARGDDSVAFIPYLEAGISDYSLTYDGVAPLPGFPYIAFGETKLNFDFTHYKLGLAGSWRDFYVNAYFRGTSEASDTMVFTDYIDVAPDAPPINWNGDRQAYSVSVGYNINASLAVFGGYRDSETSGDGSGNSKYSFQHDGFTVGASYRWGLTDTGGLSVSLGYALLDFSLAYKLVDNNLIPKVEEDGSGYKFSVVWRDYFNDRTGYTVGFEYFDYDYEVPGAEIGLGKVGDTDVEERESSFSIGLFHVL